MSDPSQCDDVLVDDDGYFTLNFFYFFFVTNFILNNCLLEFESQGEMGDPQCYSVVVSDVSDDGNFTLDFSFFFSLF